MKEIKVLVHKGQFVLKGILRTGNCEAGQLEKEGVNIQAFRLSWSKKNAQLCRLSFYVIIYLFIVAFKEKKEEHCDLWTIDLSVTWGFQKYHLGRKF